MSAGIYLMFTAADSQSSQWHIHTPIMSTVRSLCICVWTIAVLTLTTFFICWWNIPWRGLYLSPSITPPAEYLLTSRAYMLDGLGLFPAIELACLWLYPPHCGSLWLFGYTCYMCVCYRSSWYHEQIPSFCHHVATLIESKWHPPVLTVHPGEVDQWVDVFFSSLSPSHIRCVYPLFLLEQPISPV